MLRAVATLGGGSGGGEGGPPTGPAAGDLSGLYPSPQVSGLRGRPILATAPAADDVLVYDGFAWTPGQIISGGSNVTVSPTPPPNPASGDLWFDSTNGNTYVWYVDPTSSQWVIAVNVGGTGGITDAPSTGRQYSRIDATWIANATISADCSAAVGDGVADDTAALNTFLAAQPAGMTVYLPPGKRYLINSGNLIIPGAIRLQGGGGEFTEQVNPNLLSTGSILLVNPAYSVVLRVGADISAVKILQSGLLESPTPAQVIAAVAQWVTANSVGLQVSGLNIVRDCLIIGFTQGIRLQGVRNHLQRLHMDNICNLYAFNCRDNNYAQEIHCVPYYGIAFGNQDNCWRRPGSAFFFDGAALNQSIDGFSISDCFCIGWQNGYNFVRYGGGIIHNCGAEMMGDGWQPTSGVNGTSANTVGMFFGPQTTGRVSGCRMGFCQVSFDYQQGDHVVMNIAPESTGCVDVPCIAHHRMGTGTTGSIAEPSFNTNGGPQLYIFAANTNYWEVIGGQVINGAPNPPLIDPTSVSFVRFLGTNPYLYPNIIETSDFSLTNVGDLISQLAWHHKDQGGGTLLEVYGLAPAGQNVNFLQLEAGGPSSIPAVSAAGADAAVSLALVAKSATSSVYLQTVGAGSGLIAQFAGLAGANSYPVILPGLSASRAAQLFMGGNPNNLLLGGPLGGGGMAGTATGGFPMIPYTVSVPPSATPANAGNGAAMVYNPGTHTLNIYDGVAGGWHHVTLQPGAG